MFVYNMWHLECLLSTYQWEKITLPGAFNGRVMGGRGRWVGCSWTQCIPAILGGTEELLPHMQSVKREVWRRGQAKEFVYLPQGMVETNNKLHYLSKKIRTSSVDCKSADSAKWWSFMGKSVNNKATTSSFILNIIMLWLAKHNNILQLQLQFSVKRKRHKVCTGYYTMNKGT